MLSIPTDLDRWNPNDVTAWLRAVEDDETVTDAEFDQAQAAVDAALLGTTAQA
jgi:hypothetical protein